MRFLSYFLMLLFAVSLFACGGGGGSAGTTSGSPVPALTTTAPSSLTVGVGASQSFLISGGKAPYSVSSSNVQVSIAGTKEAALTIGGVAPGTATITVADADAKTSIIAVTVGNLAPLATSAPAILTLVQGTKRSFSISGGVPGYSVESGDTRFVAATVSGSTLTLNAVAIGTVPVLIRDAVGTQLSISVTVGSSSTLDVFTNAPAALAVAPQTTTTFTVGGGTLPYSVVSNNTQAAIASINGTVLTITSFTPSTAGSGNVATITVRDANAKTATPIAVTVTALPFVLSASDITSFIGDVIDVSIFGGTPPYRVLSSNDLGVSAALLPSGNVFRLTLNNASVIDVMVFDANNQQQKVKVTAQAGSPGLGLAPSAVTVSENDTQDIKFTVSGAATTGTISVFSSDSNKLQASITGNIVTVRTGTSRCVNADTGVNIDVIDSKGAKGTATVTIKDNGGPVCP